MRYAPEFLDELRRRSDITELASAYTELRRAGRNLVGLCPFHNERTPSFTVYPDNQSYYCFGCGVGGDSVNFVMRSQNLDYSDAVRWLCDRVGMAPPEDKYDDTAAKMRMRTYEANRLAARFFHDYMLTGSDSAGRDYFEKRGVSKEMVTRFGLGYAPAQWDSLVRHLGKKGFSPAELVAADLARKTKKGNIVDAFRGRVMYPIIDVSGRVVAFGGRVLNDTKPKYINTSDTLVYTKGRGIFGLNLAKNSAKKTLILCEGYMDVISYHQFGFNNAVAGLGTALTKEQAHLLSRYADEVILSYDGDEAGRTAARRSLGILSQTGLKLRVVTMRGGKDPDEILHKWGAEYMRAILDGAGNDTEFYLAEAKAGLDISTDDGKLEYINKAVPILAGLRNTVEAEIYIRKLSEETGVRAEAIVPQIQFARRRNARAQHSREFNEAKDAVAPPSRYGGKAAAGARKAAETIIVSVMRSPDFAEKLKTLIEPDDMPDDNTKVIYSTLLKAISDRGSQGPLFISDLSAELSQDQVSELAGMTARREEIAGNPAECLDCAKYLKDERKKGSTGSADQLSDEDFLAKFKNEGAK